MQRSRRVRRSQQGQLLHHLRRHPRNHNSQAHRRVVAENSQYPQIFSPALCVFNYIGNSTLSSSTKAIKRPPAKRISWGLSFIPLVSSSKNLRRPAPVAGKGASLLRLREPDTSLPYPSPYLSIQADTATPRNSLSILG